MKIQKVYSIPGKYKESIAFAVVGEDGVVHNVWVDNEHRKKGLGKKLIAQILKDFKTGVIHGTEEGELIYHCHPENAPSNALAKASGFNLWHRWYLTK